MVLPDDLKLATEQLTVFREGTKNESKYSRLCVKMIWMSYRVGMCWP